VPRSWANQLPKCSSFTLTLLVNADDDDGDDDDDD
jgi:hypothetical protein